MAHGPVDPHELLENFVEAMGDEKKRHEFNLKYSQAFQTLELLLPKLENLASSSTTPSSSFHLLCNIVPHLAAKRGSDLREDDMPQRPKDLISIMKPLPPLDPKGPSKASLGSKSKELENLPKHGDQQTTEPQSVGGHITDSNYSLSLSISDNNSINAASPNHPVSPHQKVNIIRSRSTSMPTDSVIIENMPIILSSDHEDTKLGFTVSTAEMPGALSNIPVSPTSKEHQALLYAVVATSASAFIISSTALILHKKRPALAKKMQKAAFVFGAFGFMGILGIHLPASITWWFTLSAFLVCMLMFFVATYVDVMYHAN